MISFEEVNYLAHKKLAKSRCTNSTARDAEFNNDEQEEDEQSSGDENNSDEYDEPIQIDELDCHVLPNVSSSRINVMHIFDSIDSYRLESFFNVEVDGQKKYMYKQTGNWYFSKTKPLLSSNRLNRVREKQYYFFVVSYMLHFRKQEKINNIFFCFSISDDEVTCNQTCSDNKCFCQMHVREYESIIITHIHIMLHEYDSIYVEVFGFF